MPLTHETIVYDVHDFKIYPLLTDADGASPTYGAAVDVPGIAEVGLDPNFVTAELKGDARVMARKGRVDRVSISATYGKLSLDVLKVLLGGVVSDTASTAAKWKLAGANSLPYFKAAFKIDDVDTGVGDVHVTVFKGQLTGGTLLGGSSDEFGQPTLELEAIPTEGTDELVEIEMHSTIVALPA